MVLVAAIVDAVYGIDAISGEDTARGIVFLVIAAVQTLVALLILGRNPADALFGILLAMLNGTVALLTIAGAPRMVDRRDGDRPPGDLQPVGLRPSEAGMPEPGGYAQPATSAPPS